MSFEFLLNGVYTTYLTLDYLKSIKSSKIITKEFCNFEKRVPINFRIKSILMIATIEQSSVEQIIPM